MVLVVTTSQLKHNSILPMVCMAMTIDNGKRIDNGIGNLAIMPDKT